MMDEKSPAVDVAKKLAADEGGVFTLRSGVRVQLVPVAVATVDEARSRIKDPPVPRIYIKEKDREEENPADPIYLRALEEAEHRRGLAALDTLVLLGVELVDGLPENDGWLRKLKFLEKRGNLDLSCYDLEDELEREFVYKRYVLASTGLLELVSRESVISEVAIKQAEASFRRDSTGDADN